MYRGSKTKHLGKTTPKRRVSDSGLFDPNISHAFAGRNIDVKFEESWLQSAAVRK